MVPQPLNQKVGEQQHRGYRLQERLHEAPPGGQAVIGGQMLRDNVMNLEFRRFQKDDFPEYTSWFMDPELDRRLGPIDQEWLDAVLSKKESEGVAWTVLRDKEMVALIETVFDPQGHLPAGIAAIAINPGLRRQGIGTAVLERILHLHYNQGIHEHVAYVTQVAT